MDKWWEDFCRIPFLWGWDRVHNKIQSTQIDLDVDARRVLHADRWDMYLDDEHEKIVDDLMRARQKNLKSRPLEKEKMTNRLEEIIRTAIMMGLHGLPSKFVEDAARAAMDYDGIYDLMVMWREEVDSGECRKIVDTIQELLDGPILVMEKRMKGRMKRGEQ